MIYTIGIGLEKYKEVDVQYVLDYFKDRTIVQYDSETTGLDCHISKMMCFQLGDYENQFVIHESYLEDFKEFLETKTLLGQNLKFDLKFLYKRKIYPNKVWDTYLAESVIFCGIEKRKALANIAKERLDIDLDKSVRDNIWEKGLTAEVVEYSANDVKFLELIKESQEADLKVKNLSKALSLENAFVLCLAYIEYCGFKLDERKWRDKAENDYKLFKESQEKLDQYIIDNNLKEFISPQIDIFSAGRSVTINWSSPKQVLNVFKKLGIPVDKDKNGKESVGEKNIAKYGKDFPFINIYLDYKGYEKLVGTYGMNFFKHINPATGRLHTQFKQLMDTGRLSSGGKNRQTKEDYINFQNIPSDPNTRSCFVAEDGCTLLISDYSGQEQVVLANKSLDPNLLAFYDQGQSDMHSFVASKMYPEIQEDYDTMDIEDFKKKHKAKRQDAKTAGFAINYGGNGLTIARNNNKTVEEGNFIYESYFEVFGGLRNYFKQVQTQALRDGYILINDVLNRKTFIGGFEDFKKNEKVFDRDFWEEYRKYKETDPQSPVFLDMKERVSKWFRFKGTIERMALNYPIQGTSAEITKISGVYFFNWIKENGLLDVVKFVNTIHDENVVECPLDIQDKTAAALEKAMNDAALIYCKRVILTATPEPSIYWKK